MEDTREALYQIAIGRFAADGYEPTSMQAIADEAEVSIPVLTRHFSDKRAIVLELYTRASRDFARRTTPLPDGAWALRVSECFETALAVLAPHRQTLRAVLPALLVDDEAGLLSAAGQPSRQWVRARFLAAVTEASDAPSQAARIGQLMYVLQLGVLLFWILDRTPGQTATHRMLALLRSWLPSLSFVLYLPGAAAMLDELHEIFGGMFTPRPD